MKKTIYVSYPQISKEDEARCLAHETLHLNQQAMGVKKVSLIKAFELGCLDASFKKYLKPSMTDFFFCVEVKDGLFIALSKYDDYSKLRFLNIEETITNEKAEELIKLFDKKGHDDAYFYNESASFLVQRFGEKIFE